MRQTAVMAAIVTSLMYLPVGGLLALAAYALLGVSFQAFVTFADLFNLFVGLLMWWILGFVPALAYAALLPRPRDV
jgi:hypothetical protein